MSIYRNMKTAGGLLAVCVEASPGEAGLGEPPIGASEMAEEGLADNGRNEEDRCVRSAALRNPGCAMQRPEGIARRDKPGDVAGTDGRGGRGSAGGFSRSQAPEDPDEPSLIALLEAVVVRHDREALDELVAGRRVCRLRNGEPVTIIEYLVARCSGLQGYPLPSWVDPQLVYDRLLDRFYLLPDEADHD